MKKIILTLVIVLLAGCATEKGYREHLNTWMGADTLALVRDWGAPTQVYSVEQHDFYVYNHESYADNPNYPYTCPDLQKIYKDDTSLMKEVKRDQNEKKIKQCIQDRQTQPEVILYQCTTTFELLDGIVINYKFNGNDCVK